VNWARSGRTWRSYGSKIQGDASKHKGDELQRRGEKATQLRARGEANAAQAEGTEAAEGHVKYGADRRGDELPAELQRRREAADRIRERNGLEARDKDEAAAASQPSDGPTSPIPSQYNFTEPQSRGS